MTFKIKEIIRKVIYSNIRPPDPPYVPRSYAQAGEDAIVSFLFNDKKVQKISYLDIGTNRPDYFNNTYLFYLNGSRGVCVESDTALIAEIKKTRPEDKVLNIGVTVGDEKEADFYIFDEKSLNTFDKTEAEKRATLETLKLIEVIKVPVVNINTLINSNFDHYPDFLSIDIEGLDLAVLKTLDFEKYPMPVICVETCIYSENHIRPKDTSISKFMLTKDYEIYADTYVNTIFVNKTWFNQM